MGSICSATSTGIFLKRMDSDSFRSNPSLDNSKYLQLKHFQYLSTLGEGSLGKVILVRRKSDQKLYGMKLVNIDRLSDQRKLEHARFERESLEGEHNPFLVHLHNIFESSGKLCMVFDFMQGGTLAFHLFRQKVFEKKVSIFFASEALIALEILHKNDHVYRDLKPENILLDCEGHLKLADFHLKSKNEEKSEQGIFFSQYDAPEVLNGEEQGFAVDFWAFGVLIFHMLSGKLPFQSSDYENLCQNIRDCNYEFPEDMDKESCGLISKLLVKSPQERMKNIREIKNHSFFHGVDWNATEEKRTESPLKLEFDDNMDLKYFPKRKYIPLYFKSESSEDVTTEVGSSQEGSMTSEIKV